MDAKLEHTKLREEMLKLRTDVKKAIYFTSLVQVIAIVASTVLLILVLKK